MRTIRVVMTDAYFDSLIAKARTARSPEAIVNLLKPMLFEMGSEFDAYLERLLASTQAESSGARTLKLVLRVWRELQTSNRREIDLRQFARQLTAARAGERPALFLAGLDPSGSLVLLDHELQQVLWLLERREDSPEALVAGLRRGMENYTRMEANLLDWLYGEGESTLGFSRTGPWGAWARQLPAGAPRALLEALDRGESAAHFLGAEQLGDAAWYEITILLRRIERYLVRSFETRYPNLTERSRTAILTSTFMSFAIFWADFAQALVRSPALAEASFQNALQILRAFAAQPYFPLYGGLLAIFDGPYLRAALGYLGEPLRQNAVPLEKAKVLNLLGYTCRYLGEYERSIDLHTEALADQRDLPDRQVVVANLVNLGGTHLRLRQFTEAVELFERALVSAREAGDSVGEAHALANLGNALKLELQHREASEPTEFEQARIYLHQGLERSRQVKARAAEVAALIGLGSLELHLGRFLEAELLLMQGVQLAHQEGDLWWEGIARTALAETLYSQGSAEQAVAQAAVALLMLERLGSTDWRQPAGLLTVLRGHLGEGFIQALEQSGLGEEGSTRTHQLLQRYSEG